MEAELALPEVDAARLAASALSSALMQGRLTVGPCSMGMLSMLCHAKTHCRSKGLAVHTPISFL